jgi:hypothetical protein
MLAGGSVREHRDWQRWPGTPAAPGPGRGLKSRHRDGNSDTTVGRTPSHASALLSRAETARYESESELRKLQDQLRIKLITRRPCEERAPGPRTRDGAPPSGGDAGHEFLVHVCVGGWVERIPTLLRLPAWCAA